MQERQDQQGGHHYLYDADRISDIESGHFQPAWWEQQQKLQGQAHGRGAVAFIDAGETGWVLRHYRRGGLVAKLITDHYLWLGLEQSRAFREWRLLAQLRARELPVPAPVAAHVVRSWAGYRADLITVRIADAQTLAQQLLQQRLPPVQWQELGTLVARFHAEGVYHHDLNAHNIMLGADGCFWLIDFDKGRLRKPGAWQKANCSRLLRSLNKLGSTSTGFHFTSADWQAFLGGYLAASTDSA